MEINTFISQLEAISKEQLSPIQKTNGLFSIFKEFINHTISKEKQYFPTFFSKVFYLTEKEAVPKKLSLKLYEFNKAIKKHKKKTFTEEDFQTFYKTVLDFLLFLKAKQENQTPKISEKEPPEFPDYKEVSECDTTATLFSFEQVIVKDKTITRNLINLKEIRRLECICENGYEFQLYLLGFWEKLYPYIWKKCLINIVNVKKIEGKDKFVTTAESFIVLEPNYLMDVTELSECFTNQGANPHIYFLNQLRADKINEGIFIGNVANHLFDELILNKGASFDEIFDNVIKVKYLESFVIGKEGRDFVQSLKQILKGIYENLKNIVKEIKGDDFSIEPAFISPKFGLQGRLDLMIEFHDEPNRKDVIELKSGSVPSKDYFICDEKGNIITIGVWYNHFAQTTYYNIILDSIYKNRTGSSSILYAKEEKTPIRNVPNFFRKKQEVILLRNQILAHYNKIRNNPLTIFELINNIQSINIPAFAVEGLITLKNLIQNANELERAYFLNYYHFILNEIHISKLGSPNQSGYCALWLEPLEERKKNFEVITDLVLDFENSDFEKWHLVFKRNDSNIENEISTIRKGDYVILSPQDNENNSLLTQQLFKSTIKEIDNKYITLSLRNKETKIALFKTHKKWMINIDNSEHILKSLLSDILYFAFEKSKTRNLLLGEKKPEFYENKPHPISELTEIQNQIFNKAINTKDYYLIQGPPGTGKTSYLIKNIVKHIYNNSEANILLLAYTNRAVDEICRTLAKLSYEFIRLGNKESTELPEYSLQSIVENKGINYAFSLVKKCRIFVGTSATIALNQEIFELKKFEWLIIDEASQLLEPYLLGILPHINKFIMIGDERQLPAISLQNEKELEVTNKLLNEICLFNNNTSVFERLIRLCRKNGWEEAIGMLKEQARMHIKVQEFPNKHFYNSNLKPFPKNSWQYSDINLPKSTDNPLLNFLSNKALAFIDVDLEYRVKMNQKEAHLVTEIIKHYHHNSTDIKLEIGVISPFRLQCSEILKNLKQANINSVTVDTVERYQGSERDIIIISLACNNKLLLQNIQNLTEIEGQLVDRKLNVALTRARKQVVILGNSQILSHSEVYKKLITHIKEEGGYIKI